MPKLIFDKMPVGISPDMVDLEKDNWCVFDIETNGFLPEVRVVHCIVIETPHGIERYSKFDKPVELGIKRLNQFEIVIGHNISGYDLPALLKMGLYDKPVMMCDTHISAKVAFPKPDSKKFVEWYDRLVPERHGNLWDNNGLKSWGCRIGEYKGNFGESTDWQECTEEMVDYCEQDVKVNTLLFKKLREEHSIMWKPLRKAVKLETECNWFFAIMAIHGFRINANKAYALAKDIEVSVDKLKTELPWHRVKAVKRLNKDGEAIGLKIKSKVMNVNSNRVNGDWAWLFKVLGKPHPTIREFDKSTRQYVDKPTASAKILVDLDLPELTPAIDLIAANKAYSTIRKGAKSILTSYESSPYQDNRIHTEMSTTGTETYRCNHKNPNVNFPKVKKDKETKDFVRGFKGGWGVEFREVVETPDGWSILGADAKGLEFRMLGHSTYQFDNGALLDIIMNACIHTASAELYTSIRKEFGIHEECSRDEGKGVSYGYMYGGGADKLGRMNKGGKALGERLRERLAQMWNLTALLEHLGSFNDKYKHIKTIDGRLIPVKSAHSLLNYLLQSSGGIVCKAVVIQFVQNMLQAGYVYGDDFEVWLFVHDELQVAVRDELVEPVGKILLDSFEQVGKFYKLQCPLEGDLKVGKSWADTH
jgi:DNA polymerase I